jgi:hypothetical protein
MEENPFDDLAPWWRRRITVVILVVLVLLVWWFAFAQSRPSPVWVAGQAVGPLPEQEKSHREDWVGPKQSKITALAEYRLEARVLGRRDYSDEGAFLSPMDLALGWGEMSEETVINGLKMSQSGRWYHYSWSTPNPPIPLRNIIEQSANTHLIPANDEVAAIMDQVVKGDRVRLSGVLISASRPDGWRWRSSLSRSDSGNGACELMWVEKIEILPPSG